MGNHLVTPRSIPLSQPRPPPGQQQQQQSPTPPTTDNPFTCEICIEPIAPSVQTSKPINKNCGPHPFCNDCMIKYIQAKLDDNVSEIPCPALDCSGLLNPHDYSPLVGPRLFVKWCDALCEAALIGIDRSYCPNRNCSALILNECGGNVKKAACPSCKRVFCFQCKLPWHAGFGCEENGELRDGNDRAFGVLAEQKMWKRCPQCHHFVELIEGCQIVRCRCAATFCYRCGGKVNLHGYTPIEKSKFKILHCEPLFCQAKLVHKGASFRRCLASFCYKCGRKVNRHWCNCNKLSRCYAWSVHASMGLVILVFFYFIYFRFPNA